MGHHGTKFDVRRQSAESCHDLPSLGGLELEPLLIGGVECGGGGGGGVAGAYGKVFSN